MEYDFDVYIGTVRCADALTNIKNEEMTTANVSVRRTLVGGQRCLRCAWHREDYERALSTIVRESRSKGRPLPKGGAQKMTVINESGVHSLIFQSRKPEAVTFKRWVTCEVLPQIRRTGSYAPKSRAALAARNEADKAWLPLLENWASSGQAGPLHVARIVDLMDDKAGELTRLLGARNRAELLIRLGNTLRAPRRKRSHRRPGHQPRAPSRIQPLRRETEELSDAKSIK